MTRTASLDAALALDYPKEKELVTSPHYTLRFSASTETEEVEVSIDAGPWQATRRAGRYFWFDWSGYLSGRHFIVARAELAGGQTEETPARRVVVELEPLA
jgi:hypothetical protein